jgi:hypothetical protein
MEAIRPIVIPQNKETDTRLVPGPHFFGIGSLQIRIAMMVEDKPVLVFEETRRQLWQYLTQGLAHGLLLRHENGAAFHEGGRVLVSKRPWFHK